LNARPLAVATLVLLASLGGPAHSNGQTGAPAATRAARQSAPIDLTGYWVSFVTEDWRFRMITPPKGDYTRVPLTAEGRKVADGWNPTADAATGNQCRSYGAAAIMRVPGRFHITWQDDNTLHVDVDAGMQTRVLQFMPSTPGRERTWQGHSIARWDGPNRSLTVVTTNMRAGYLRRNGVPYSENATVTEHFDVAPHPNGERILIVTTIVDDPRFLQQPFIVSSHFKQEKDGAKWNPMPCSATW
jgi:hypothetical protein